MKIDFKDFVTEIIDNTVAKIRELALEHIDDATRKAKLDSYITSLVTAIRSKYKPSNLLAGFIFNLIVDQALLPFIPMYTQHIYDLLKKRIAGKVRI